MDEKLESVPPARTAKEALRDGGTLRAKFFRWKDRVMAGGLDQSTRTPLALMDPTISPVVLEAMKRLTATPDDQEAYTAAVAALRRMAKAMKDSGMQIDPDAAEE